MHHDDQDQDTTQAERAQRPDDVGGRSDDVGERPYDVGQRHLAADERASVGAAERSRRPKTTIHERDDTRCAHCGKRISPGRNGRRRYCNAACSQRAYRQRQRDGERAEA